MSKAGVQIPISKMAAAIQQPATVAAAAKARQLRAEGVHVYDFGLGEPDFPTPEHICRAATKAMQDGHTHYTPASGIPELRSAIAKTYQKVYGLRVSADQVIVSNGAKHSIATALEAIVGPGDEVIIPTPYWVSYSDLVQMTGATPVLVPTTIGSGFKMSPSQLRQALTPTMLGGDFKTSPDQPKGALTPRTRLVMINSPNNPTGAVYTRQELEALADVILDTDVAVLSDEIYERLVYGAAQATCFATLRPELAERTLTVSGVSKSYAMTGWRMGWTIGPLHVIKTMGNVQSQQTSNPSSISQYATLAALEGDQECVEKMRREFEARRDLVCRRLAAMRGLICPVPPGAFYAFVGVSGHFGRTLGGVKVVDSASFCKAALEGVHVNLVPGSAFGAEGYVRLSFAASREQLNGGLDRLEQFLK
jgi:aspartate aminotransferase